MADAKIQIALKLEEAKTNLESQIREAIKDHRQRTGKSQGTMEFDFNLEDNSVGPSNEIDGSDELKGSIRTLVDLFHRNEAVVQSGMRVYKLTAIDSDGDGEAAVNIKYEYAVDTGMSPGHASESTLSQLPASSAGKQ